MNRDLIRAPFLALALAACGSLPPAHIYSGGKLGYINDGYKPEGREVGAIGAPTNEGRDFCRDLENRARVRAVQQLGTGWTTGVLAALAIGFGTVLTASSPDNPSKERHILNASLPVAGAALGFVSFGEFSREKDASDVAATAATAINLEDAKANAVCNEALGSWNNSRPSANKALMDALKIPSTSTAPPPVAPPPPAPPVEGGAPEAPNP